MRPSRVDVEPLLQPPLSHLMDATSVLAEHTEESDRAGSLPAIGLCAVHDAGLLSFTVGQQFGGPGGRLADTLDYRSQPVSV